MLSIRKLSDLEDIRNTMEATPRADVLVIVFASNILLDNP